MVAALEREVRPLVKHWTRVDREYEGRRFKFFEAGDTVICLRRDRRRGGATRDRGRGRAVPARTDLFRWASRERSTRG